MEIGCQGARKWKKFGGHKGRGKVWCVAGLGMNSYIDLHLGCIMERVWCGRRRWCNLDSENHLRSLLLGQVKVRKALIDLVSHVTHRLLNQLIRVRRSKFRYKFSCFVANFVQNVFSWISCCLPGSGDIVHVDFRQGELLTQKVFIGLKRNIWKMFMY